MADLESSYKAPSTKESLERGIEVLSRTLESIDTRSEYNSKGFTFGDLFIKVKNGLTSSEGHLLTLNSHCSAFASIRCSSQSFRETHQPVMIQSATLNLLKYSNVYGACLKRSIRQWLIS